MLYDINMINIDVDFKPPWVLLSCDLSEAFNGY